MFNCCVDMPDAQPDQIAENLSINDMESLVEIVLEQAIGIENAIAEHDEPDNQAPVDLKYSLEFCFYQISIKTKIPKKEIGVLIHTSLYEEKFLAEFASEIVPPPPQA